MLRQLLLFFIILIIATYFVYGIYLSYYQNNFIFYPGKQPFGDCQALEQAEKINHQGTRFYTTYISDKYAILYHGNGGTACDRAFFYQYFVHQGYTPVLVEYTGYAADNKTPSISATKQNVQHIHDWISHKSVDSLIILGESFGSGPASYHTYISNQVNSLIFITAYTSITDVAQRKFPFYPARLLIKEDFNNRELLKEYSGDLLLIHGEQDQVLPFSSAEYLYHSLQTPNKEFLNLYNANHSSFLQQPHVWQKISEYFP